MKRILTKALKIASTLLLILAVLVVVFGAVSYRLYYSPQAANLPCRNCEGQAKSVRINGFDLYYREIGINSESAPIVLIHGGPGQSSQTFKNGFDFLAKDHRVIFYDQRGSGNSQIKPGSDLYTINLLVDDLEMLRRDVIRSEKMVLSGHSAGGALALRYAMTYPQHVEKMVLVSALPPNGGQAMGGVLMDTIIAAMNVLAGNIPPSDPLQADEKFNDTSFQTSISRLYDPSRSDLLKDMGYVSQAVNRDITRSTMGGNFDDQLSRLDFPTLIIYGQGDRSAATGEIGARQLKDILPNSTLAAFEQSGHWPYLEEPERFQSVLNDFLGRIPEKNNVRSGIYRTL